LEQHYRRFLIQWLVIIAALWRLDAGWTAIGAGAFLDYLQSGLP